MKYLNTRIKIRGEGKEQRWLEAQVIGNNTFSDKTPEDIN